jgi:hemerythrin-like domain-containing protein
VGESPTIFEALRDDHDTQRTLIDLLVETTGDSEERRELFARVRRELTAHAGAEERHFYVPLMGADTTQEKARHSVAEHNELDELIERLEEYDRSGSAWLPTAEELRERLLHHLDEEEQAVFPLAGKVLTPSEKRSLAADYKTDMARRREFD